MKKVLLIAGLVLALAAGAGAQDAAKKMNFYLGAGLGLPMSDFGDAYKMGLHGTGAVGFVVAPGFSILGKVEYHTFSIDDQGASNVDGGSFNALMFGGAGRYNFQTASGKMSPFLMGGLGMANGKVSDLTIGDTKYTFDSETKLYFEFGGGVDIAAGQAMSLFIQGRYVSIQTDDVSTSFIPVTVGLKF